MACKEIIISFGITVSIKSREKTYSEDDQNNHQSTLGNSDLSTSSSVLSKEEQRGQANLATDKKISPKFRKNIKQTTRTSITYNPTKVWVIALGKNKPPVSPLAGIENTHKNKYLYS